jgi:hypothetical protein
MCFFLFLENIHDGYVLQHVENVVMDFQQHHATGSYDDDNHLESYKKKIRVGYFNPE